MPTRPAIPHPAGLFLWANGARHLGAAARQDDAEHIAATIFDAIRENVATKADLAELRAHIDRVEHRLLTRLGGLAVVLWGLLVAVLHYWPPHG